MEMASLAVLIGVSLGLSFLFAGMESGLFALSRLRIRQQMKAGKYRAKLLNGYLEKPEDFLWTILVGNTLATLTVFMLLGRALHGISEGNPGMLLGLFFGFVLLFYGLFDLLPKMLFRQFPNRMCLAAAIPFRFIHVALSPLIWLMTRISRSLLRLSGRKGYQGHLFGSRSELRIAMQESAHTLSTEERSMISRVLDLQTATVGSIIVPLLRVISVEADMLGRDLLALCAEHRLTRLPVWQGSGAGRRIGGIVSLKHALYSPGFDPGKAVGSYITPALYLREDMPLEEALRRMQRSGQRLAIVLGHDAKELGVVSLQDILRFIFGEVSL